RADPAPQAVRRRRFLRLPAGGARAVRDRGRRGGGRRGAGRGGHLARLAPAAPVPLTLRLGNRGSALAGAQARIVAEMPDPDGAVVGTGSLRRRAQLLARRPDLRVEGLRGNVDTRLRRLGEGRYQALVLAAAGLARLGLDDGAPLPVEEFTPAGGQGCLALE